MYNMKFIKGIKYEEEDKNNRLKVSGRKRMSDMKIMTKGRCSRQGTLLEGVSVEALAGIYTEVAEEIRIDNAYIYCSSIFEDSS